MSKKPTCQESEQKIIKIKNRKTSEGRLRLQGEIISNMTEGIYFVRASDAIIVYTNPKFEAMFGYEPSEMVGKHVSIVNAPTDKNPRETAEKIMGILEKTGEWHGEVKNIKKDGTTFWCYANVSEFDHPDFGQVLLSVHSDITDRKKAEEELTQSKKDLQKLAGRLISNQEEETRRLARELHDDFTQRLAVLAIDVGNLEQQLKNDLPKAAIKQVSQIKENIIKISEDIHNLSRNLHPSILDDLGLVRAIKSECNNFSSRMGIAIVFIPKNVPAFCPPRLALAIYRIIQESLSNIAKHAKAKNAYIFLEELEHNILLSVRDTGIGFNPSKVKLQPSLGFGSMRERVRLVDGSLSITSEPAKGTCIEVSIPLKKE
jgi:PAS domain S-box-containing protein